MLLLSRQGFLGDRFDLCLLFIERASARHYIAQPRSGSQSRRVGCRGATRAVGRSCTRRRIRRSRARAGRGTRDAVADQFGLEAVGQALGQRVVVGVTDRGWSAWWRARLRVGGEGRPCSAHRSRNRRAGDQPSTSRRPCGCCSRSRTPSPATRPRSADSQFEGPDLCRSKRHGDRLAGAAT